MLPSTVVCYGDNTLTLPLLTAYARNRHAARPLRRLFDRRQAMMDRLVAEYRDALSFRDARAHDAESTAGAGGR
jgi:deoxyhypusine synthase